MGANFLGFNGICVFSDRRRSRRQRSVCGDFINLEELPIGVGLRAYIHRDECACVFVSVCVCTVFLKKKIKGRNVSVNIISKKINSALKNSRCLRQGMIL